MPKLISIIIPTFNRAYILGETLDSIKSQTYVHWECIVVDDGSNDSTDELMSEYCSIDNRFKYYKRPSNRLKGPNSCRNIGFDKSIGDFVNFFDSDDLLKPNAFSEIISAFTLETDVVVSGVIKFEKDINNTLGKNRILSKKLIEDYIVGNVNFYTEGPVWRRNFLKAQKEIFDDKIRNLDDWDFILRMLYKKPKIFFLKIPVIYHRVHSNSLSQELNKNNIKEISSAFKARYKHLDLIKRNNVVNQKVLVNYIKIQYKRFIKQAIQKSDIKLLFYLIKLYLKHHFFKNN